MRSTWNIILLHTGYWTVPVEWWNISCFWMHLAACKWIIHRFLVYISLLLFLIWTWEIDCCLELIGNRLINININLILYRKMKMYPSNWQKKKKKKKSHANVKRSKGRQYCVDFPGGNRFSFPCKNDNTTRS